MSRTQHTTPIKYDGSDPHAIDFKLIKKFDRAFTRPILWRYLRFEVEGLEHLPKEPCIVTGNHSGGVLPPDVVLLLSAWNNHFDFCWPLHGLAHDTVFFHRISARFWSRVGMVRASPQNAEYILQEKLGSVLVYPGGGDEMFRSFARRNQIDLKNRKGFIRLSLKTGAPIVPAVCIGAHETLIVLTEGQRLAKMLPFLRPFRIKTFPISFILPWGITSGYMPYIPLPAKVKTRFLAPISFPDYGPADCENEEVLQKCYDVVQQRMQEALDNLAQERKWPIIG